MVYDVSESGKKENSPCAMERTWLEQQKLPPNLRSAGLLLVCNCPKCTRRKGTL